MGPGFTLRGQVEQREKATDLQLFEGPKQKRQNLEPRGSSVSVSHLA